MPENFFSLCSSEKTRIKPSPFDVKLYTYQALRGTAYFHGLHICHRDIKPRMCHLFFYSDNISPVSIIIILYSLRQHPLK